jgi:hypothetical protein
MRTGQVDESSFFVAYWFPRIGVYDDVRGWNDYTYTGVGEFYNDFGDFSVGITVPERFVVWATGTLQNPGSVLSEKVLERYHQARKSEEVIPIIDAGDLGTPVTSAGPRNTWHYSATRVSDFAFALSDHYRWDGLTIPAGPDGSPVFISAAYDPGSDDFRHVAGMAKKAIRYMTGELPGLPFPYPSITVFNGLDEMEYPMMVNDLSNEDLDETFKLTAHEIAHSYFPFLTGCNEREYAWMDEGLTSFFDYHLTRTLSDPGKAYAYFTDYYLDIRGTAADLPLLAATDILRAPDYYALSYAKTVFFYSVLMEQTGRENFRKAIAVFADQWAGKHPTGYDLIQTFSRVSGEDLSWLVQPWFLRTGSVDLALAVVEKTPQGHSVTVENRGSLPAAIRLRVIFADGDTIAVSRPPDAWREGNRSATIRIDDTRTIRRLELTEEFPMDADPGNGVYLMDASFPGVNR